MEDTEHVEITEDDVGTIEAAEVAEEPEPTPVEKAGTLTHALGVAASNGRAAARNEDWATVTALMQEAETAITELRALAAEQSA